MRDPYLYDNSDVLRNILGIKEKSLLEDAEADYVSFRLKQLAMHPLPGDYSAAHYMNMHQYIFQDIYKLKLSKI